MIILLKPLNSCFPYNGKLTIIGYPLSYINPHNSNHKYVAQKHVSVDACLPTRVQVIEDANDYLQNIVQAIYTNTN